MHKGYFVMGQAYADAQSLRVEITNRRAALSPHIERLYAKVPEPILARMREDERDPLMDIFERGKGYVRIDFGPAGQFQKREHAEDACRRLAIAWTDEVFVDIVESTCSFHLHLFPAELPPHAKPES